MENAGRFLFSSPLQISLKLLLPILTPNRILSNSFFEIAAPESQATSHKPRVTSHD